MTPADRDERQSQAILRSRLVSPVDLQRARGDPDRDRRIDLCAHLVSRGLLPADQAASVRAASSDAVQDVDRTVVGSTLLSARPPVFSDADAPDSQRGASPFPGRLPASSGPMADPAQVGPYRIGRVLGRGGMGVVYDAVHVMLRRRVALKLVRAGDDVDDQLLRRFEIEARSMAGLDHPNVLRVHEVGTEPGSVYLTMDLVDGGSLADRIGRGGPLAVPEAVRIARQLALGIGHAHGAGVIHRDLKPSNVLLREDGEPVIADFGLAKNLTISTSGPTEPGQLLGTPAYMSPEQVEASGGGSIDPRTDIYAIGICIYEMIAGRPPIEGATPVDIIAAKLARDAPSLAAAVPDVPSKIDAIVTRCLARDPNDRYPSANALAEELAAWLAERETTAISAPPAPVIEADRAAARSEAARWRSLALGLSGALLAAVVTLGAVAVFAVRVERERREAAEERDEARLASAAARTASEHLDVDAERVAAEELYAESLHWPPSLPGGAGELEDWIDRAQRVAARLPDVRAAHEALAASATTAKDRARLEALETAVTRLESIATGVGTAERRLDWIERIAESDRATAGIWAKTLPALRDLETPQPGLVPIGADPRSGLQEFAHVLTGAIPERDGEGQLILDEDSALILVYIDGGSLTLGATPDEQAAKKLGLDPKDIVIDPDTSIGETPRREVTLSRFFVAKHELTQAQWRLLSTVNPSLLGPHRERPTDHPEHVASVRHPVEFVAWYHAARVLESIGLRLPTEAQWEFVAREGGKTRGDWGPKNRAGKVTMNVRDATYAGSGLARIVHPWEPFEDGAAVHAQVGSFPANALGIHDLLGNVEEWCLDEWASYRESDRGAGDGLWGNPDPNASAGIRVVRGGCWARPAREARPTARRPEIYTSRSSEIGVRAVWIPRD